MASPTPQGQLFGPDEPGGSGAVVINGRCTLRRRDGHCAVSVAGVPVAHYAAGDRMAEAYAMVTLVQQGHADQREVARGFSCATRTVRRSQRRFEAGGLAALGRGPGYPKGVPRLSGRHETHVSELKASGLSNRAIAVRVGVSEKAVRKLLTRLGWKPPSASEQLTLSGAVPNVSASSTAPMSREPQGGPGASKEAVAGADPNLSGSLGAPPSGEPRIPPAPAGAGAAGTDPNLSAPEPLPISLDTDPADRRFDRILAALGLLDDAAPLFRPGRSIPHAGVLLAIPALVESGVLDCARAVFGGIGPAFFGLRTTVVTMLLMALLRIKRPEALKEHSPPDLGRLVGLDRAPEVKTLRRKLTRLASLGRAVEFGRALAHRRVASHGAAMGFLYVDGHVRAYHGSREIPKTHVARTRIAMPATTDYWLNDAHGEPVLVLTAQANAGLVKMLPPVLAEIRKLLGDRRVTVVFDRGGWSPALFEKMIADGFDVLTYRKGRSRKVARRAFADHTATLDGRKIAYRLADQRVRLRACKPLLRQVTRLSDNGHQTQVITSRTDLAAVEVAFRMFERWKQENFFKYLREEYALDALADHRAEDDDPARDVPNPKRKALDAEIARLRSEGRINLARCGLGPDPTAELLAMAAGKSSRRPTPELAAMFVSLKRYMKLVQRQASVPLRVPVREVVRGPVVRLATERKHLTNVFKMTAFQIETALVGLVTPHYDRADDEARTLVQTALSSAADLAVTETELRVTLAPLSSHHRSLAISALCNALNKAPLAFPGTNLRLRFAVAGLPSA